jgi:hypothetical protein
MTASRRTSTSISPGGVNEVQLPRQPSLSDIPDSRPPTVDPMSPSPKSGTLRVLHGPTGASIPTQHDNSIYGPLSAPCSPSGAGQPLIMASLSFAIVDDPGNLSDLTDLPTEIDSSPHSAITAIPVPNTPDQQPSMKLSLSSSSASVASSSTQLVTGSQLKSKLVFDYVEIPQPEWYGGRREKIPTTSRQKRKQITGPSSSDITGFPDSDNLPSAVQEISNRSSSKRKRKMSQGPASR